MINTFFNDFSAEDFQAANKHNIDKFDLAYHFMKIFDGHDPEQEYNELKSFLQEELKRKMTPGEELNLLQLILDFNKSEPVTIERSKALNSLFQCDFIISNNPSNE